MRAVTRDWVRTWAARLVRRATLAVSSADRSEQIEQYQGDPDDPEGEHPVQRMQWYGLRSRPGKGTELICVSPEGGTSQRVAVAGEAPGTGPTDQEEWEVEIYAQAGQRIRLTKDGDVIVIPKAGRKVKLGSDVDGELDLVVLYSKLKAEYDDLVSKFNAHTHLVSGVQAGVGNVTSAATATPASALTSAVGSPIVVAKKP